MHIIKAILGIDVSQIRKWGQNGSGKRDIKRTNDSMVVVASPPAVRLPLAHLASRMLQMLLYS